MTLPPRAEDPQLAQNPAEHGRLLQSSQALALAQSAAIPDQVGGKVNVDTRIRREAARRSFLGSIPPADPSLSYNLSIVNHFTSRKRTEHLETSHTSGPMRSRWGHPTAGELGNEQGPRSRGLTTSRSAELQPAEIPDPMFLFASDNRPRLAELILAGYFAYTAALSFLFPARPDEPAPSARRQLGGPRGVALPRPVPAPIGAGDPAPHAVRGRRPVGLQANRLVRPAATGPRSGTQLGCTGTSSCLPTGD